MGIEANQVAAIVLAGGQGTRLFPLTLHHSKPAVSFGGRYRLIDIPISNALHSGFHNIFVIAQYLSSELQHHISHTYRFDFIQGGSVDVLTPSINEKGEREWFDGTADAVRKMLPLLLRSNAEYFLVLAGDHLYNIDFRAMVDFAASKDADLTIACLPVPESDARRFGLVKIKEDSLIGEFYEKPNTPELLSRFALHNSFYKEWNLDPLPAPSFLASMGIYVFKRSALIDYLKRDPREDFGKHIIATAVPGGKTFAFVYNGYWEDIGTVSSYYQANLLLTEAKSRLQLYDEGRPIYTRPTFLPGPQVGKASIHRSILCEGCIVEGGEIDHSIIGLRSRVGKGTTIRDSIVLGNLSYLPHGSCSIGENCLIEKAILDEHVTVGKGVRLVNREQRFHYDGDGIFIREGLIIVPSGAKIPDHFEL